MMKNRGVRSVVSGLTLLGVLASSAVGFAQGTGATVSAVRGENGQQEQNMVFGDELVQGQLVRPDSEVTRQARRAHGPSLLPRRSHFVSELLKSVEAL